jgi:hypothetical protein
MAKEGGGQMSSERKTLILGGVVFLLGASMAWGFPWGVYLTTPAQFTFMLYEMMSQQHHWMKPGGQRAVFVLANGTIYLLAWYLLTRVRQGKHWATALLVVLTTILVVLNAGAGLLARGFGRD